MKTTLVAFFLTMAFTCMAFAGPHKFDRCFYSMDGNGDKVVSAQELETAYPADATAILKAADTDKSGTLDHDEWEGFKAHHGIEDHH